MACVWITGAHGFIGRHLAHELARKGYLVNGIGHGDWSTKEATRWGVTYWLNGDLNEDNLRRLASVGGWPEVVFHLAGGSSVGAAVANPCEDFERTVAATSKLLEWLRLESSGTRLVAVSSAAVYGSGHEGMIPEDALLNPFSPYGYHKLMMESLCRSYGSTFGLKSVVARLFSVYGSGLRKQLLWDLCNKLKSGINDVELGGTGFEIRDWTDVRDVVRALTYLVPLASIEAPSVNVGSGVSTSVRQIADQVVFAWNRGESLRNFVFSGRSRVGDPFSLQADPARLKSLGFDWCIPVRQGLADYVNWFKRECL